MTETSPHSATPAKARAEAKLSAGRVARSAIGDLMTCSSASALSPLAIGCLVLLAKHACAREQLDELGSSMQVKDAQTVLAMKGLSFGDSDLVLSALQMSGLLRLEDGEVSIPVLDGAIQTESISLANRVAGWNKRGAPAKPRPTAQLISMPLPQHAAPSAQLAAVAAEPAAESVAPVALPVVDSLPSQARPAAAKKAPSKAMVLRFTSKDSLVTDPAEDPVVVRIDCDGDRVAEITQDYQNYLESIFGGRVDVLQQLKLAASWSRSNPRKRKLFTGLRKFLNTWLTNATSSADVRQAVVAAGNQKNGFGQGGGYGSEAKTGESAAVEPTQPEDEFADLLEPASAAEPPPAAAVGPASAAADVRVAPAQGNFDDLLAAPSEPTPERQAAPVVRSSLSSKVLAARAGLGLNRGPRPGVAGARPTHLSQR